jgi:hypothetical protein
MEIRMIRSKKDVVIILGDLNAKLFKNKYIIMWQNVDLLYIVVDYKKSCDTICRNKIIECLAQCNVAAKLKRLS